MTQAAKDYMERKLGILQSQWNERLGSDTSDVAALERKLGVRIEQWLADFGGTHLGSASELGTMTADNTLITADSGLITADAA